MSAHAQESIRSRVARFARRLFAGAVVVGCTATAVAGCGFANPAQGPRASSPPSPAGGTSPTIPSSLVGHWSGTVSRNWSIRGLITVPAQTYTLSLAITRRPKSGPLGDPVYGSMTATDPRPAIFDGFPAGNCTSDLLGKSIFEGGGFEGYPTGPQGSGCVGDVDITLTLVGPNTLSYSDSGSERGILIRQGEQATDKEVATGLDSVAQYWEVIAAALVVLAVVFIFWAPGLMVLNALAVIGLVVLIIFYLLHWWANHLA